MLEILFVISLSKRIGNSMAEKGYARGKYQWMLVGMWFGGELLGAILGGILFADSDAGLLPVYFVALLGAGLGAWGAFAIAKSKPALESLPPEEAPQEAALTPRETIVASVIAFLVSGVSLTLLWWGVNQLGFNLFYDFMRTPLADDFIRFFTYLLSWGLTGLLVGGLLTRWRQHWKWAGVFAATGVLFAFFISGMLLLEIDLLMDSVFVRSGLFELVRGLLAGLTFGFLARGEAPYREPDPLLRMALAGLGAFLITGLISAWIINTLIAPGGVYNPVASPMLIDVADAVVLGALEGLALGLALELPRLAKPAGLG